MGHTEALQVLQQIAQKPVFATALRHLKSGCEIRLVIDQRSEFALYFKDGAAVVEERAAERPDVEFSASPEALRVLNAHPGDNMAQFGIAVLEQILGGEMSIRVCGSYFAILSGGYLNIILAGGPDFLAYLSQHGLQNIGKITALFRTLKR